MEVDHAAMQRQAASGTAPTRPTDNANTNANANAMEHDPTAAPQIVDNPPMSFQSGAVPDHYESYPEVMPPQGLGPPSAYPQSAQSISPATSSPYDRYQAISPPPPGQSQPLMQNPHYDPNQGVEKTYYQPTYGVSQPPPPTPYSNTNTLVPDPNNAAPAYDNKIGGAGGALPAPVAYNAPAGGAEEKKILGMKKKTFWIVLIVVIILILAGIGGAVGGILASKNKDNNNSKNIVDGEAGGNGTRSGGDGGDNNGYTPYALTTGVRTLNLEYSGNRGSCNDPSNQDGAGIINCFSRSTYIVRVDGSVRDGYRLSSVDVQGSNFSNIRGIPPLSSDPTEENSGWVFEVSFSQGGSCGADRVTRYVLGPKDNIYAIGEAFSLQTSCQTTNGNIFPAGTQCTCIAISTTAEE